MASKCKLTYFTIKGLGEPIRYLLAYRDIEFEDVRIDFQTWTSSVKQTTPFGKLPVLEINGKILTQSIPICRYLAKEAGLSGKDDWENLQIDIMADTVYDLRCAIVEYYYDPNKQSKAAKKDVVLNETLPFYLKKFNTIVGENNGYLANKKLSWADFSLLGLTEYTCFLLQQDIFEPYPHLRALLKTVHEIPNIKKYIEKRPAEIALITN